MKKFKITQHQAIFYQLYKKMKQNKETYTPIWKLIGEIHITEFNMYAFVSYEVSARMSEIYGKNPNLFDRTKITGISGSKYYAYRIKGTSADIIDPDLKEFFIKLKARE